MAKRHGKKNKEAAQNRSGTQGFREEAERKIQPKMTDRNHDETTRQTKIRKTPPQPTENKQIHTAAP
jgi:hypothetical protein